ncbi:unnamed protein product, partial [Rotaria magnacalcarata]
VYSDTAVVAPLETLNTNLNYKILDDFVGKMTDSTLKLLSNNDASTELPFLFSDVSTNRFHVEPVDNNNDAYGNDKKMRTNYTKLTQYSINTINELPEKSIDDER